MKASPPTHPLHPLPLFEHNLIVSYLSKEKITNNKLPQAMFLLAYLYLLYI